MVTLNPPRNYSRCACIFTTSATLFGTVSITRTLKSYEEDITRMLTGRQGIWLSNRWTKILFVFLAVYSLIILLYVKFV